VRLINNVEAMTAVANLLEQRSQGAVKIHMARTGVKVLREAGCSKIRLPKDSTEGILINTSGGLAGGDHIRIEAAAQADAALTLTTQAAERVYRTLGPAAEVTVKLHVDRGASLHWLPQETIFYQGSALSRRLDVTLEDGAELIAVESMVFGRKEMGESVSDVDVTDHWRVCQNGRLVHAEALKFGPHWTSSRAAMANMRAVATLLVVSSSAEGLLEPFRRTLGPYDGASAWNGKLVARLVAEDGYSLRKTLIQALGVCIGSKALPKCWTF
jgi:urease accessory protein